MTSLTETLKRLELGERLLRRNPWIYPHARAEMSHLQQAAEPERREWARRRLAATLAAARRTPYGRRAGGGEELQDWPLLDKQTVRARPRDFLAGPTWLSSRARTSGTTGMPLQVWRSADAVVFEQVCIDWFIGQLGVDARSARIAVLRGDLIGRCGAAQRMWSFSLGGRRLTLSSNDLTPATLQQYVDTLQAFKPDVLCAYPTSLENLCRLLRAAGCKLDIPRVLTSSEVLHARSWQLAYSVLECTLLDYYGQCERLACAYAAEPQQYRFLPGYSYVELLPLESAEEGLYEIVGTSLWNRTMPLVRYRTGDLIRLPANCTAHEVEQVAWGLRAFDGVIGRDQEVLLGPDGTRLTGINQMARELSHVIRIQVIQEAPEEIRILVLPDADYRPEDEARLTQLARLRFPVSMNIRVETVQNLERTAQGKAPLVIHRPAVRELLQQNA